MEIEMENKECLYLNDNVFESQIGTAVSSLTARHKKTKQSSTFINFLLLTNQLFFLLQIRSHINGDDSALIPRLVPESIY